MEVLFQRLKLKLVFVLFYFVRVKVEKKQVDCGQGGDGVLQDLQKQKKQRGLGDAYDYWAISLVSPSLRM